MVTHKELRRFSQIYSSQIACRENANETSRISKYFAFYNIYKDRFSALEIPICTEWQTEYLMETQIKPIIIKSRFHLQTIGEVISSFVTPTFETFFFEKLQLMFIEEHQKRNKQKGQFNNFAKIAVSTRNPLTLQFLPCILWLRWLYVSWYSFALLNLRIRIHEKNKAYFLEKLKPHSNEVQHVQLIYFAADQTIRIYDYCLQTQRSSDFVSAFACHCFDELHVVFAS